MTLTLIQVRRVIPVILPRLLDAWSLLFGSVRSFSSARCSVVRFQHKHFVEGALFLGLVVPTLLGATWGEPLAGLVWGGGVARLCIFHTTFCINSLAHWTGMQPYTDEVSSFPFWYLCDLVKRYR
jgi:fatty-acid desaturase